MAQVFHPAFNTLSRASVFGGALVLGAIVWVSGRLYRSPYVTEATVVIDQPVQFSHQHHVGGLGIDCRYCHGSVEVSAFAGIPPAKTCMNCHSQIWADSPILEPIRRSAADGTPVAWNRVHRLPGYAYFDHSIHVAKGVACVTCHGQVNEMPLLAQHATLYMEWCLDCHRHPERSIRPRDKVFEMNWRPDPREAAALGPRLAAEYGVQQRTDCADCHR